MSVDARSRQVQEQILRRRHGSFGRAPFPLPLAKFGQGPYSAANQGSSGSGGDIMKTRYFLSVFVVLLWFANLQAVSFLSCFYMFLLDHFQGLQRIHARAQLDGALGWVTLSSSGDAKGPRHLWVRHPSYCCCCRHFESCTEKMFENCTEK